MNQRSLSSSALSILLLIACNTAGSARNNSNAAALNAQSIQLYSDKRFQEALKLELRALSCAPRSATLLLNLGLMYQSAGDQPKALTYFARAHRADPTDWRVALSQAKSLMLMDRLVESLAILEQLNKQGTTSFERQFELTQALLFMERPDIAIDSATKTLKLANSAPEKSQSIIQLYLCLIRNNQYDRARDLQHDVFRDYKGLNDEVYIQAAYTAKSLDPGDAEEILKTAVANVTESAKSELFFRLGQIFEEKAEYVAYDRTNYGAWLKHAQIAYKQALTLNQFPPIYRLAIAENAAKRGEQEELIHALSDAHNSDAQDQLPGYLLSKLKPLNTASVNITAPLPQAEVKLTRASLSIDGLKCSCKRSIIINSFKQIRGLILTTIAPRFPYEANILVDESIIPLSDVLSRIEHKPLPELTYKLISSTPVKGAAEALQLDIEGRGLSYPPFEDNWPELKPESQLR